MFGHPKKLSPPSPLGFSLGGQFVNNFTFFRPIVRLSKLETVTDDTKINYKHKKEYKIEYEPNLHCMSSWILSIGIFYFNILELDDKLIIEKKILLMLIQFYVR